MPKLRALRIACIVAVLTSLSCLVAIRKDEGYKFAIDDSQLPPGLHSCEVYLKPETNRWIPIPPVAFASGKGPYTVCIGSRQTSRDSIRYATLEIDSVVLADSAGVPQQRLSDSTLVFSYEPDGTLSGKCCIRAGVDIEAAFISVRTYGRLLGSQGTVITFRIIQNGYKDREWSKSSIFEWAG